MFQLHHCHPCVVVFGTSLQLSVSRFCTFSRWCVLLSCISVSLPSVTRATLYVPSARAQPQVFLYPTRQRRWSASMLFWVMILHTAGVSLSCDMVVQRGLLRRVVADLFPLFHKRFSRPHWLGSTLQRIDPLCRFFFSGVIKCWCGTITTKLSQTLERDSHDLCRFSLVEVPSRWWGQLDIVRVI